jgi:hypothetical protein
LHPVKQRLLTALARLTSAVRAGRTGKASRCFRISFVDLARAAGCADGDALEISRTVLTEAASTGIVRLRHPRRDAGTVTSIELDPAREEDLYAILDRFSPTKQRAQLAAIFIEAQGWDVPQERRESWDRMCEGFAAAAGSGGPLVPFSRTDAAYTAELLRAISKLLQWKGESLLRFASCQVFGNSKQLERWRSAIEAALSLATDGNVTDLAQLGILENPRACLICGPMILHYGDRTADLRQLTGPITLSSADLAACARIESDAVRFCTVENPTTFHELAKLRCNTLFACTDGYAKLALFQLVRRLDPAMAIFHFGDSDPAGFDILRHLRVETKREIWSVHMKWRAAETPEPMSPADRALADRLLATSELTADEKSVIQTMLITGDKGAFEQEHLGVPSSNEWPFYP